MRTLHATSATLTFALLSLVTARTAHADDDAKNPWIERPLSLKPLTAEFQAGFGIGQGVDSHGNVNAGSGANLEAGVGLPFLGDINVRTGYRFDTAGRTGGADFYGRLFDHQMILNQLGTDPLANPEIRWRSTLFDAEIFAIGFESRFLIPIASNTDFSVSPGIPMRFRIPHIARIDTGLFVPIAFTHDVQYTFSIPAELYIQVKDWFFGPMTGFRFDHIETLTSPLTGGTTTKDQVDIQAGIGGGYTVGGFLDLKAQLYTLRINDSNWSNTLGGGVGVGLLIP
jgi:hypothetical protein